MQSEDQAPCLDHRVGSDQVLRLLECVRFQHADAADFSADCKALISGVVSLARLHLWRRLRRNAGTGDTLSAKLWATQLPELNPPRYIIQHIDLGQDADRSAALHYQQGISFG